MKLMIIIGAVICLTSITCYILLSKNTETTAQTTAQLNDLPIESEKNIVDLSSSVTIKDGMGQNVELMQGKVSGIYTEYSESWWKEAYGEDFNACTAFEILTGDEKLIARFKDEILAGNTINRLSEKGNLIINLPWSDLSLEEQVEIKKSDIKNPISLRLSQKPPLYMGVGPCYAVFSVSL